MSTAGLSRTQINARFARAIGSDANLQQAMRLAVWGPSSGASERYAYGATSPPMRRRTGSVMAKNPVVRMFDIANEIYDAAGILSGVDYRRDQTTMLSRFVSGTSQRIARHPWAQMISLINTGGTDIGPDGLPYFSASHVFGDSGTQSNAISGTTWLNVADPTAPTPEEAADVAIGMLTTIQSFLDDQGQPMNQSERAFTFVAEPRIAMAVRSAIMANNLAGGETSVVGSYARQAGWFIDAVPDQTITAGGNHVYLFAHSTEGHKPFIVQEEKPLEFFFLDESSERFALTGDLFFRATWQGGVGYGEPLKALRATLA